MTRQETAFPPGAGAAAPDGSAWAWYAPPRQRPGIEAWHSGQVPRRVTR